MRLSQHPNTQSQHLDFTAKIKRKKGTKSPTIPGIKNDNTKIGTIIIRPIVKILGILIFIISFHEKNHEFFLQPFLQFLQQILNL